MLLNYLADGVCFPKKGMLCCNKHICSSLYKHHSFKAFTVKTGLQIPLPIPRMPQDQFLIPSSSLEGKNDVIPDSPERHSLHWAQIVGEPPLEMILT